MSTNVVDPNLLFKRKVALLLLIILFILPVVFVSYKGFLKSEQSRLGIPAVTTWFHRFKKSDADGINSLLLTDNGYLVLGDTSPSDRNSFVKELDFNGTPLWSKTLQSNINMTKTVGVVLNETYLISYISILNNTQTKPNVITGFSVKIDKQTHRTLDRSTQVFKSIAHTTQGYIGVGEHNKLFMYDENGDIIWEKRYREGFYFTGINTRYVIAKYEISRGKILKIVAAEDNNFILMGQVKLAEKAKPSPWMFKIDKSGKVLWHKELQNNFMYPSDIVYSKDQSYLFIFNDSRHRQVRCQKYSSSGILLWSKSYANNEKSLSWHVAQTGDGNYILTGASNQADQSKTMWLLKVDNTGELLWQRKRTSDIGDYPSTMIGTLDGGVLIGGKTTKQGFYVDKKYKEHVYKSFELLDEGSWLLKLSMSGISPDPSFTFTSTNAWHKIDY